MRRGLRAGAATGLTALLFLSACDLGRPAVVHDNVPGRDVAAGDVNGDGRLDLVSAGFRQGGGSIARLDYSVLIGDGTGHFTAEHVDEDQDFTTETMKVALADVDEDGDLDLLRSYEHVVDGVYDEDLAVSRNDGSGHFGGPEIVPNPDVVDRASDIDAGDLNDDGAVDVVLTSGQVPVVYVYLGDGPGNLRAPLAVEVPLTDEPLFQLDEAAVADLDADGHADIVASGTRCVHTPGVFPNCGPSGSAGAAFLILYGDGTGRGWSQEVVPTERPLPAAGGGAGLAVGDFDEDGRLDLATAVSTTVGVWLAQTDGTFRPGSTWQAGIDRCPVLADIAGDDVDGDGRLDIAVVTNCGGGALLLGDGDGGRLSARPLAFGLHDTSGLHEIVVDDLTSDGQPDLAVGGSPFCPCNSMTPQIAAMVNALGSE